MFSHAPGYIFWKTHALVRATTSFWTHWMWHQTWAWCSRLHESTNLTINSQVMLWNGVLACMKAPVVQNVYSRAGDNTFFNIEYAKNLGTTGCHPREYIYIYIYIYRERERCIHKMIIITIIYTENTSLCLFGWGPDRAMVPPQPGVAADLWYVYIYIYIYTQCVYIDIY